MVLGGAMKNDLLPASTIASRRNEIQCSRNWRCGDAIRCPNVTPRNCCINFRSQSGCQTVKCHSIRRVRRLKHMVVLQQDLVPTPKVRFDQVVVDDSQQRAVCTHMLDTTPEPLSPQAHLDKGPFVHTRSCRTLLPLLKHVRAEACNCATFHCPSNNDRVRFIHCLLDDAASNLAAGRVIADRKLRSKKIKRL